MRVSVATVAEFVERVGPAYLAIVQGPHEEVASLEDVLTQKVLALSEQRPDFSSVLELARSLREQVDWDEVRERTRESPFAKAYFTLLDELEIVKA